MIRPHDALLDGSPAFAQLYPILDEKLHGLLLEAENTDVKLNLQKAVERWTKLKIIWSELLLLAKDLPSLNAYIASLDEQCAAVIKDLELLIECPEEHLSVLENVIAQRIDVKLRPPADIPTESRQLPLTEMLQQMYKISDATVMRLTKSMDAARYTSSIAQDEAQARAMRQDAQAAYNAELKLYTTDFKLELNDRAYELQNKIKEIAQERDNIEDQIRRHEAARTPSYLEAAEEHFRLSDAIKDAERDILRMRTFIS